MERAEVADNLHWMNKESVGWQLLANLHQDILRPKLLSEGLDQL